MWCVCDGEERGSDLKKLEESSRSENIGSYFISSLKDNTV